MSVADKACSWAWPGSYGHECGDPACSVAVFPSTLTTSGLFFAARCALHAKETGGENSDAIRIEPLGGQVNVWK